MCACATAKKVASLPALSSETKKTKTKNKKTNKQPYKQTKTKQKQNQINRFKQWDNVPSVSKQSMV